MSNPNMRPTIAAPRAQETYLYFTYVVNFNAIAAGVGTAVQVPLQIQADSDFEWIKGTQYAFPTGFTENAFNDSLIPELTLQFSDTGSGRFYSSSPVPVSSYFGTGKLPFILPFPQRFIANATINFTMTNLSAAQAYTNVILSLIGKKIYKGQ